MTLKIPTRTERAFNELRGEYRDVEIEDRPYRVLENQYIEFKGLYEDVKEFLTDYEILEAGGLDVFFNADGTRTANWPWTGKDQRKKPKKKVAKKKKVTKKKTSK